jgi:NADPH:quinone reductase-like Zn-dependent oxidoreductase
LKHEALLKSLGATHVIDRQIPLTSLRSEVEQITTLPFETVFDAVSMRDTQQAGYELLAPGGSMVIVLPPAIKPIEGKDLFSTHGAWTLPDTRELGIKVYDKLFSFLEEGVLRVRHNPSYAPKFWN